MITNYLRRSNLYTIALIMLTMSFVNAEEFPLRSKFPSIPTISTADLAKEYDSIIVVDVRSEFEFNVIHVAKSVHIPIAKSSFGKMLEKALGGDKTQKAAVYCNGHTCSKSYKAAKKAKELGFTNVVAFDAGIFEWTMANPDKSTLLGESPADKSKIISKDDFSKKLVETAEFEKQIAAESDAFIIDARDPIQRKKTPTYKGKIRSMPMDKLVKALANNIFKKSTEGKKLYIFDAVGKQVRWLQYYLEKNGVTNYCFLKGGVWSVFGEEGAKK